MQRISQQNIIITGLSDRDLLAISNGIDHGDEGAITDWQTLRENWKIHDCPPDHSYSRFLDLRAGRAKPLPWATPLVTFSHPTR